MTTIDKGPQLRHQLRDDSFRFDASSETSTSTRDRPLRFDDDLLSEIWPFILVTTVGFEPTSTNT